MGIHLSYATAHAVMIAIHDYTSPDFDALGITQQDFLLAAGEAPWTRQHIPRVMKTLNALIYGTLEVLAMPKIVVPAEYVAAIVSTFVAPGNRMVACVWLAQEHKTGASALELGARADSAASISPTSADQLFALVIQLSDTDQSLAARREFTRKLGIAVNDSMFGEAANG